jgi:hypothetical protein
MFHDFSHMSILRKNSCSGAALRWGAPLRRRPRRLKWRDLPSTADGARHRAKVTSPRNRAAADFPEFPEDDLQR